MYYHCEVFGATWSLSQYFTHELISRLGHVMPPLGHVIDLTGHVTITHYTDLNMAIEPC